MCRKCQRINFISVLRRGHYYTVLSKLFSTSHFLGTSYLILEGTQHVRNEASEVVIIDL